MDLYLGRIGQITLCQRSHRIPPSARVFDVWLSRVMTGVGVETQLGHLIKGWGIVKERDDFRPHPSRDDAGKSERSRGKGCANFRKGDREIH